MQWLRRSFLAGLFVTVPLFITVAAFIWIFNVVDGLTTPFYDQWLGRRIPGLGTASTAAFILMVGAVATNVIGRRILAAGERVLLHIPMFRTIYAPVKQLMGAFAPDNQYGLKRVVMIEDPKRGYQLGFLTKEFGVDRGQGSESLVAVYVPTNHLYLGDIVVVERDRVTYPDLSVEEGISIFLTGGMAIPSRVRGWRGDDRVKDFRV